MAIAKTTNSLRDALERVQLLRERLIVARPTDLLQVAEYYNANIALATSVEDLIALTTPGAYPRDEG